MGQPCWIETNGLWHYFTCLSNQLPWISQTMDCIKSGTLYLVPEFVYGRGFYGVNSYKLTECTALRANRAKFYSFLEELLLRKLYFERSIRSHVAIFRIFMLKLPPHPQMPQFSIWRKIIAKMIQWSLKPMKRYHTASYKISKTGQVFSTIET